MTNPESPRSPSATETQPVRIGPETPSIACEECGGLSRHYTDCSLFVELPRSPSSPVPSSDLTCPCGNRLIRAGVVVMAHWCGSVCQECEATMFEKFADRVAHQHDNEPDEERFPR